jgi:hypothetical protein
MSKGTVERERLSAQYINRSFVRKLEEGRVKEAADEGSRFIRSKLRQESFAREILEPVDIGPDEIDRDENTDQPKKIIEKEPDSVATFVTFKGSGQRTFFRGPRYSVYFGKVESKHFMKSKFELLTYQNDIRQILTDNSVKDMADQEDSKFIETIAAAMATVGPANTLAGGTMVESEHNGGETFLAANAAGLPANGQFSARALLEGNDFKAHEQGAVAVAAPLSRALIAQMFQAMTMKKLPVGKLLMTKATMMECLKFDYSDVGSEILARHYDKGLDGEEKVFGIPTVTTIKNDIINDNEIYCFAPENYLGNFFLLQDATLYIKQEADMIEFWSYSAPGIGIGNAAGVVKLSGFTSVL